MTTMTLNGEGEPRPTLVQAAMQAATIELFTQWQTYANGVHMDWDTFRSIDFRALAVAALTGAGFSITAVDATLQLPTLDDDLRETPKLRELLTQPGPFARAADEDPLGRTVTDGKVPSRTRGFDHHTLDNVTLAGTSRRPPRNSYDLTDEAVAEHAGQVQG